LRPVAAQLIAALRQADIPARGTKCGIIEGIKNVEKIVRNADGRIGLRVHPRCKNFIREMSEDYKYSDMASKQGDAKPIKIDDHGPDAFRYWAWARMRANGDLLLFTV